MLSLGTKLSRAVASGAAAQLSPDSWSTPRPTWLRGPSPCCGPRQLSVAAEVDVTEHNEGPTLLSGYWWAPRMAQTPQASMQPSIPSLPLCRNWLFALFGFCLCLSAIFWKAQGHSVQEGFMENHLFGGVCLPFWQGLSLPCYRHTMLFRVNNVPMKFHDLPSEQPDYTTLYTEERELKSLMETSVTSRKCDHFHKSTHGNPKQGNFPNSSKINFSYHYFFWRGAQ